MCQRRCSAHPPPHATVSRASKQNFSSTYKPFAYAAMALRGVVGPTLTEGWDACCVAPSLWVGAAAAVSLPCLHNLHITHVLSVMRDAPCPPPAARVLHLAIDMLDIETEFLLDTHIPAALKFIQAALDVGGRVLVHCQHGHSRSVAVAAAFLMRSRNISAAAAIDIIAAARRIDVNPAFQVQLLLLQHTAAAAPPASAHSRWRLARLQSRVFASRDDHCNAIDDLQPFAAPAPPEDPCHAALKQSLRCCSCSFVLALHANVASCFAPPSAPVMIFLRASYIIIPPAHFTSTFSFTRLSTLTPNAQVAIDGACALSLSPFSCPSDGAWAISIPAAVAFAGVVDSSLHGCVCVELLPWMLLPAPHASSAAAPAPPQVSLCKSDGRLMCPKCGSKLGRWTWGWSKRDQCSGAVWSALCVTFALQRNRLR